MAEWVDEHGIPLNLHYRYEARLIPWQTLDGLPTLGVGQGDDRKIDNGEQRVWLSRMTREDGEHCDHHVTVETYDGNRWAVTSEN